MPPMQVPIRDEKVKMDEQDKGPLSLEASRGGISISIDLPRLLLEILDDRTLDTIMEDGKTLRQILEEIVEDPVREALGGERYLLK